jgi:hypothetical protein
VAGRKAQHAGDLMEILPFVCVADVPRASRGRPMYTSHDTMMLGELSFIVVVAETLVDIKQRELLGAACTGAAAGSHAHL